MNIDPAMIRFCLGNALALALSFAVAVLAVTVNTPVPMVGTFTDYFCTMVIVLYACCWPLSFVYAEMTPVS
jgi:hypothetical protein